MCNAHCVRCHNISVIPHQVSCHIISSELESQLILFTACGIFQMSYLIRMEICYWGKTRHSRTLVVFSFDYIAFQLWKVYSFTILYINIFIYLIFYMKLWLIVCWSFISNTCAMHIVWDVIILVWFHIK